MRLKKVISFLFIALVLTNMVHNAIPHHHHMASVQSHECCDHHDCDMENLGSSDLCTHCEAFNGMEYYPISKNNKIELPKHAGSNLFALPASLPDTDAAGACGIFAFADLPNPYGGPDQKSWSHRGPPSAG